MIKTYEILRDGEVINTILADEEFAEAMHPGAWRVAAIQPEPPMPSAPPEWEWYIDLGPFFDRFGPGKLDVLTSPDAGVKALLADLQIRKWIDLKRADVAQGVQYIGMAVLSVTPEIVHAILNTPVTDLENRALRKLYFGA